MSTLKATNLQHPSAASPNVVLGSTGSVAVAGALTGAGMDLIATQSFSSSSIVSFNNCFTSTYENYKIVWTANSVSSLGTILLRLRASGTDNTTTNYGSSGVYALFAGTVSGTGYNAQNYWAIHYCANTSSQHRSIELMQPQVAYNTSFGSVGSNADANAYYAGWFGATTQFDGFSILPGSGTMTGTVRVYGYRNS